jgi:Pyridine nucleotide-disulphide oxidoreductase
MKVSLVFVGLIWIQTLLASVTKPKKHYPYIIVGAGPGGVQLGHYLDLAGRDYLILEQHDIPGSFFARFPRWRQLISINKPYTGINVLDHSFRHDWNSLLSETSHQNLANMMHDQVSDKLKFVDSYFVSNYSSSDPRLTSEVTTKNQRFTDIAEGYYPSADLLSGYLKNWTDEILTFSPPPTLQLPRRKLRIQFSSNVTKVERPRSYRAGLSDAEAISANVPRFQLSVKHRSGNGDEEEEEVFTCTVLIWAAGLQLLNKPEGINVAEMAETYWTHSTDISHYRNKSVLILGRGNAAFEIANHVLPVAAFVHMLGRAGKRLNTSSETHYPGDVRHVHSTLLETSNLKSMDGFHEHDMSQLEVFFNESSKRYFVIDHRQPCEKDAHGRLAGYCFFRQEYDFIISCPGWKMATSPFHPNISPKLFVNKKHPAISARYDSVNVQGLFFAGNLGHAHDFKKASGGFIHGFRYTIRALHRIFEEEQAIAEDVTAHTTAASVDAKGASSSNVRGEKVNARSVWPHRVSSGLRSLLEMIHNRIQYSAGPYQMFGNLVDVVIFPPTSKQDAEGFQGTSIKAACTNPSDYLDSSSSNSARSFERIINKALVGGFFEEVPVPLLPYKARFWSSLVNLEVNEANVTKIETPYGTWFGREASKQGLFLDSLQPQSQEMNDPIEYITLTMEYGNLTEIAMSSGRQIRHGEWPIDSYSLSRQRENRLIHPVLRYYHSSHSLEISNPLYMQELPEDFHLSWNIHSLHLLPIARFLELVGTKRAQLALLSSSSSSSSSNSMKQRPSMKAVKKILQPYESEMKQGLENPFMSKIHALMTLPGVHMVYKGEIVNTESSKRWLYYLSTAVADELIYRGPEVLVIHWDQFPRVQALPLTDKERELTSDIQAAWANDAEFAFTLGRRAQTLQLSEELKAARGAHLNRTLQWFSEATRTVSKLLVLHVPARAGMGLAKARAVGLSSLPYMQIFHASLGETGAKESDLTPDWLSQILKEEAGASTLPPFPFE